MPIATIEATSIDALTLAIPAVAIAGVLAIAWPRVRGTTLVGPWCWAVASLVAVAGVDALLPETARAAANPGLNPARYIAAVSTFCPVMAILGAKRPQDRAWQFVVLTMLVVLALPGLEALLFGTGRAIAPHAARRWFLAALVFVGWLNYLPTRRWLSSCLYAAAQLMLLAEQLPVPFSIDPAVAVRGALALAALAALWALIAGWLRRPADDPFDRLWRDFRNSFGALWAFRVQDRVRAAAGATAALGWSHFLPAPSDADGASKPSIDERQAAEQTFLSLLRRFVSQEWIDARWVAPSTQT
ncbi:MAG: hypothetical protein HYX69_16390 [Planctomycetia bacterium]|nr:hypothetical protein [Planctomycetia bacterium]